MIRNGTTLPGRSPAHQEVVGALDQACAIWGLAGGDGRSRFIQHCVRYGLMSLLDAGVLELPEAAEPKLVCHYREMEARLSAAGASATEQPMPPEIHGIQKGLSTGDGGVPAAAVPACGTGGAGGIKAAICAACWPRQNAFESSGLVLRNPILLLSILAISGIACSGTSPASTPAATDFNRASCPALKSRCFSGLRCRTSASPQPHKQTGFWNQPTSVTTWDLRRAQARFIDSLRVSDFVMLFCSFAIRNLPVSEPRQSIEAQGDYYANGTEPGTNLAPVYSRDSSILGGLLTGWVSLRFGGILLDSGRLSSHKTFRQCFLTRAADTPEAFSKTSSKTLRRPAAKGQTLIYGEGRLRAAYELCAELCAERPFGGLSAPSRGTPTTPLPKSRDVRLFALWHGLFASGAKGRWFESTRAYHSNHVRTGIPCMLTFQ